MDGNGSVSCRCRPGRRTATSSCLSCPSSCSSSPLESPRFPTWAVNEVLTRRQHIIDERRLSTKL